MAKLSKMAQAKRLQKKPKFKVRAYNRCELCGRFALTISDVFAIQMALSFP